MRRGKENGEEGMGREEKVVKKVVSHRAPDGSGPVFAKASSANADGYR